MQGDAISFMRNVKPLVADHPTYQGGVGHTFMGAFYLAAPWPVQDLGKAQVCGTGRSSCEGVFGGEHGPSARRSLPST